MKLETLYKIFAVLHALMGLMMLFGGAMISNMNGWDHSIGIVTMAEHHGAALLCVSLLFWMLPKWLSEDGLKDATSTALLCKPFWQLCQYIMPRLAPYRRMPVWRLW